MDRPLLMGAMHASGFICFITALVVATDINRLVMETDQLCGDHHRSRGIFSYIGVLRLYPDPPTTDTGRGQGDVEPVDHEAPTAVVVARPAGSEAGEELPEPAFRERGR